MRHETGAIRVATAIAALGTIVGMLASGAQAHAAPPDRDASAAMGNTPSVETPLVITVPSPVSVTQTTAAGTPVTYAVTFDDLYGGVDPTSACTPASGSTFPVGTTAVTCSASDAFGATATQSFTVTVVAAGAPVITVPAYRTLGALVASGLPVTYAVTATDPIDGATPVSCSPASGTTFPVGTTTVTCIATNKTGKTATKTFDVTVDPPGSDQPTGVAKVVVATGGAVASVTVSCAGAQESSCAVTLQLLAPIAPGTHSRHGKAIASATVDLAGGEKQTVRLRLTAAGTRQLRKRHRLAFSLRIIGLGGGKSETRNLAFKG